VLSLAALERLPADLHEIVYMKFFLDMRNLDIAEATGLSSSHVGVKVHRTLRQLRRLLQESPAGVPEEADG
jgi:DNA-directed RNA polymerase specialized sigma24 family protein